MTDRADLPARLRSIAGVMEQLQLNAARSPAETVATIREAADALSAIASGQPVEAERTAALREASKAAHRVHMFYVDLRDAAPIGSDVRREAQACLAGATKAWHAVAALEPREPNCAALTKPEDSQ